MKMGFRDIGNYLKEVRLDKTGKIPNQYYPQKTVITRIENNENYMIKSLFGYVNALDHQLYHGDIVLKTPADLGQLPLPLLFLNRRHLFFHLFWGLFFLLAHKKQAPLLLGL